jgi:hypothetical protein
MHSQGDKGLVGGHEYDRIMRAARRLGLMESAGRETPDWFDKG